MFFKLKEGEKIHFVIRRYGITLFWFFLLIFILLAVPFFFMFWLFQNGTLGIALFIFSVLSAIVLLIRIMFLWRRNCLYVTSRRLVDLEQRGFFDKIVSDIPYDQIEDVSGRIKGFWGTIFRYGDISVQTGNGKVKIMSIKIKQPIYLQEKINDLREKFVNYSARDFSGRTMESIIDKLYELEKRELEIVKKEVEKLLNRNNSAKNKTYG